jgi:hypothetical protein
MLLKTQDLISRTSRGVLVSLSFGILIISLAYLYLI